MIQNSSFSKDWIDELRGKYPAADPTILERAIYAFELVGSLRKEGIEFVFKGGTSLLLLLPKPLRLSIDVDIVTEAPIKKIETALENIVKADRFTKWEADSRTESNIPKSHYKIFYNSVINPHVPAYVLLDVLHSAHPYPEIISREINTGFIEVNEHISVDVPTINGLLGDKMTAFAPTTTGISFGIGKDMEINKQLFDIGILFSLADNLKEVNETFTESIKQESSFRKKSFNNNEVVKDIINLSFLISQIRLRRAVENEITREIETGIRKIRNHLLIGTYNLDSAKTNASRCALVTTLLNIECDYDDVKEYSVSKITDDQLTEDLQILNRLKQTLPEAYYYWQQVQKYRSV